MAETATIESPGDAYASAADGESVVEGNVFVRWEQGVDGRWRIDRAVAGPRDAP